MPDNTFIYDTVYEEFREELQFTDDEMSEAIMFSEDRQLFDELMYRVKQYKWKDEQRNKWMQGEQPEYTVPEDCPFQTRVAIKHMGTPTANVRPHTYDS